MIVKSIIQVFIANVFKQYSIYAYVFSKENNFMKVTWGWTWAWAGQWPNVLSRKKFSSGVPNFAPWTVPKPKCSFAICVPRGLLLPNNAQSITEASQKLGHNITLILELSVQISQLVKYPNFFQSSYSS